MKDVYLFALGNWEIACRLRDERIAELERENTELRKLLREAITSLARHRAAMAKEAKP